MVKISDLNRREREIRKSLNDLENQLKNKKIPKNEYDSQKKDKENELRKIGIDRKVIIERLPPIPPPPKPTRGVITAKTDSDISDLRIVLDKQEKDITFTQDEVSKIFSEVVKNREKIKSVEETVKRDVSSKPQTPTIDAKGIDSRISAKVDVITNQVKINLEKSRGDLDRVMGDIRSLKMDIDSLKKTHDSLGKMDVSGLRRDIESLKTKNKWLEQQISNIDIEPIYDMIKEVDRKVSSGGSGPVIIE